MTYEHLTVERIDHTALVTLNRPDKLNAISRALHLEMVRVCGELREDDGVRVVVWTGAGRGFCSGADLTGRPAERQEAAPRTPPRSERLDEFGWVGAQAIAVYRLDKPTIAAVNGVAAGAGMSLALACDLRVGSDQARFKTVFIERNLSPDSGMSYFLPRIVGVGNALDMILTSRTVGAEEALRTSLLQRLVGAADLLQEAQTLAAQIAAHPPLAAQMSKRAVQRSLDNDFDSQLRYEIQAIGIARRATNDARESAAAFREKRTPRYTGH